MSGQLSGFRNHYLKEKPPSFEKHCIQCRIFVLYSQDGGSPRRPNVKCGLGLMVPMHMPRVETVYTSRKVSEMARFRAPLVVVKLVPDDGLALDFSLF